MAERKTTYQANTVCEFRDQCFMPVIVDGVQVEATRSTLGIPCGFEVAHTLEYCRRRRVLLGAAVPEEEQSDRNA